MCSQSDTWTKTWFNRERRNRSHLNMFFLLVIPPHSIFLPSQHPSPLVPSLLSIPSCITSCHTAHQWTLQRRASYCCCRLTLTKEQRRFFFSIFFFKLLSCGKESPAIFPATACFGLFRRTLEENQLSPPMQRVLHHTLVKWNSILKPLQVNLTESRCWKKKNVAARGKLAVSAAVRTWLP